MTGDDTDDGAEGSTDRTRSGRLSRRGFLVGAAGVGAGALVVAGTQGRTTASGEGTTFAVRIENVSTPTTLQTTGEGEQMEQPAVLSPGAYAVHRMDEPMFSAGEPERDNGLEEIAEAGKPTKLAKSLKMRDSVASAGAFATPVGADAPGPAGPGGAYEFEVTAGREDRLSFATMFAQSNDLFYAPGATGLALFEEGDPVEGDVTDRVGLWDAGTEINEEPGIGENQAPRQRGPNVGLVERGTVAPIDQVNGYDYPATDEVLKVMVAPTM